MLINVAQLLKSPVGTIREFSFDEVEARAFEGQAVSLSGRLELLRTDRGILVQADLTGRIEGACARCLVPAHESVEIDFREEFFPSVDIIHGGKLPEPENKDAFRIDEHHQLDLDEPARQYLIMARPMRFLCRPNCAGLCATCGANLNLGPCRCAPAATEERWAALRQLLDQGVFKRS